MTKFTTKTDILHESRQRILKAIEKELDKIRDAANDDSGQLFKYQTALHQAKKTVLNIL